MSPEREAPTSEQRCGDAHRDPPRDTADERRPARADEPGGRRLDSEEEPPDTERCHPGGVDADREPQRAAAETRHGQEPAEQREPEELRQRRAAREKRSAGTRPPKSAATESPTARPANPIARPRASSRAQACRRKPRPAALPRSRRRHEVNTPATSSTSNTRS